MSDEKDESVETETYESRFDDPVAARIMALTELCRFMSQIDKETALVLAMEIGAAGSLTLGAKAAEIHEITELNAERIKRELKRC